MHPDRALNPAPKVRDALQHMAPTCVIHLATCTGNSMQHFTCNNMQSPRKISHFSAWNSTGYQTGTAALHDRRV